MTEGQGFVAVLVFALACILIGAVAFNYHDARSKQHIETLAKEGIVCSEQWSSGGRILVCAKVTP